MEIFYLAITVLIAGIVGTTTGFGASTVMIPVVILFYPMPETLLFVGIIHCFGNLWKILFFKHGFRWKIILGFGIPGIIASMLGALLVFNVPSALLSRILGIFIIIYVIYLFFNSDFKVKSNLGSAITGGLLSGFMAGIFGIGGAVRSLFLTAFNLPKEVYIVTGAAIAIVIDITRLITYFFHGSRLNNAAMWGMFLFIPMSFLGAGIAKIIVNKIPQKYFRLVIAVFLLIMAGKLLLYRV